MATVAIGWRHGGTGVAQVAGRRYVRPGQGEAGGAVIERGTEPGRRGVARIAGSWIRQRNVIWDARIQGGVCRVLIVRGVAAITGSGQRAAVVAVGVAQRAGHGGVRARQRESGRAVIER